MLITAGGTGGHIFPALSVAKKLQADYEVIWVGAKSGIECEIVPKNNIPLMTVKISGLRKKGMIKKFLMPFILIRACLQCLQIIVSRKPDVIVGFGGYATFPVSFVGWILRIPVVIHEQNSIPGLTNKILAKIATYILVAYKGILPSKKTVLAGNPVRDDIAMLPNPQQRYAERCGGLNILVVGGSLGAKMLNDILPEVCSRLNNLNQVTHQVGRGDLNKVQKDYTQLGVNAQVVSFINDMAAAYAEADLIICRSGASTVSEVANVGIAAVFIPYPYAVDDHQRYNVIPLVERKAAFMIPQSELSVDGLVNLISSLDRLKCSKMAELAKDLAIPDSTDRIVTIIKKCIV